MISRGSLRSARRECCLRLGRGGDEPGLADPLERPVGALALERLPQRRVPREQVDVLERDGLVDDVDGHAVESNSGEIFR